MYGANLSCARMPLASHGHSGLPALLALIAISCNPLAPDLFVLPTEVCPESYIEAARLAHAMNSARLQCWVSIQPSCALSAAS